jgi:hypothetical protein
MNSAASVGRYALVTCASAQGRALRRSLRPSTRAEVIHTGRLRQQRRVVEKLKTPFSKKEIMNISLEIATNSGCSVKFAQLVALH